MSKLHPTFVVGSNVLMREGLARILSRGNFRPTLSVEEIDEVTAAVIAQNDNGILIAGMGDDWSTTLHTVEKFRALLPTGHAAVVMQDFSLGNVSAAFEAGAAAVLTHVSNAKSLLKTLELVALGEIVVPPELLAYVNSSSETASPPIPIKVTALAATSQEEAGAADGEPDSAPNFSMQETRILHQLAAGAPNKVIARCLGITEATVKVHVKSVLRKIRAHNRTQAAIWALSHRHAFADLRDRAGNPMIFPEGGLE